jgi:NADH-quinone oxidoreductase subunit G
VCDKGGECPLQDITFGWGLGRSRMIEPKRHFQKPLALSPLVAIDRERCILCYRCVRFSQEIAEDYQLIFAERGADTFVATHSGHPYVAPFSGNITELCPVGALTSQPYRFRARPWDIESAGGICTLCPSQCNVQFTVRDEKVMRVLANDGLGHPEVDDGWLCDKGRFAYQAIHVDERITTPLVRDGGELREVSWERALDVAAGLSKHKGRVGTLVGGQATNEEGFLLARVMREGAGSPHLDSRTAGALPRELHLALNEPDLQAKVSDLEFAHTVLVLAADPIRDAPILDLRLRKGARRHKLTLIAAEAEELLSAPAKLAAKVHGAGPEIVVLWSERLTAGADGAQAARALLELAGTLSLAEVEGAGMLEIPAQSNGRGLREAGVLPNAGPGFADLAGSGVDGAGRDARGIAEGLASGELTALYLLGSDPLAELPDRELWEPALDRASTVVAHASFLTEGIRSHADVVFPAETYAEKEGTITHPDGRLQRLRPAVAHPGSTRAEWSVIVELATRLGLDLDAPASAMVSAQLFEAVPFYAGLTLEEIGGKGVRWQEREAARAYPGREQLV